MPRVNKVSIDKDSLIADMKRKTRKNEAESIERIASITGKSTGTVRQWLNRGEMPGKAYGALMAYLDADTTVRNDEPCMEAPLTQDVDMVPFTIPQEYTELVKAFDARTVQAEIVIEYMKCLRDIYVTYMMSGGQR